jgi:hypothetical protein
MVRCPFASCEVDETIIVEDEENEEEPLEQVEVGGSASITGAVIDDEEEDAMATNMTSNNTHICNEFAECEPCLYGRMSCVWTAYTCEPSCVVADAGCYMVGGVFENMTGPEVCAVAEGGDEVSFEGLVES